MGGDRVIPESGEYFGNRRVASEVSAGSCQLPGIASGLAPKVRSWGCKPSFQVEPDVSRNSPSKERRKWARLQLAIPVFVRSRDESGKDTLEFATAVNICAGGALVVVRRSVPAAALVSLEIPSAPLGPAGSLPRSSRAMRAKTVWISHLNGCHLLGLKFARPLGTDGTGVPRTLRRKAASAV